MAQTTHIALYCPSRLKIDDALVAELLRWLGTSLKEGFLWDRRNRLLEMMGSVTASEACSRVAGNRWVMLKLVLPVPRFASFLRDHLEEMAAGAEAPLSSSSPSLLEIYSRSECSLRIGEHRHRGQVPGGDEGGKVTSWLSVSFSCEQVPSDWAGFVEEVAKSRAMEVLLNEFREFVPRGEVLVRFFA